MEHINSPTSITNLAMESFQVQTRWLGHLQYYSSVAEAYNAWILNPEIEKISWTDASRQRQIWRPLVKGSMTPETETFLCSLSLNYRDTEVGSKWWYLQPMDRIIEVTTDSGFAYRFCR